MKKEYESPKFKIYDLPKEYIDKNIKLDKISDEELEEILEKIKNEELE